MPPHAASPRPHPGRDMEAPGDTEHWQLMVALRIRPLSAAELEEGASPIAHRLGEQVVVLRDPMEDPEDVLRANRSREKSYVFDAAFDSTATQETVYRATTRGLIASIISGCNATVFAYGPTGCGKTYTMLGTDREPGIYARTLGDLFQAIEDTSGDMDYEVSMSYLEIYNETIRDLLNPSLGYLELREDSKGAIQVAGITEVSAVNAEEVMQLLLKGNKQRTQEPTAANRASSRSHAVLQVSVRQRSRRAGAVRRGRLFLIDLAGSERAAQSQNRGQRMREGAHINRSLLALGNCINALSAKASQKYVNYRDSKLTRLLKDSLGGNSRTVMIAHISPASTAFEESRSTLAYADRARSIRTSVRRNLLGASHGMVQYGSIVADLRREIRRLQSRLGAEPGRPGQGERGDIRCIQGRSRPCPRPRRGRGAAGPDAAWPQPRCGCRAMRTRSWAACAGSCGALAASRRPCAAACSSWRARRCTPAAKPPATSSPSPAGTRRGCRAGGGARGRGRSRTAPATASGTRTRGMTGRTCRNHLTWPQPAKASQPSWRSRAGSGSTRQSWSGASRRAGSARGAWSRPCRAGAARRSSGRCWPCCAGCTSCSWRTRRRSPAPCSRAACRSRRPPCCSASTATAPSAPASSSSSGSSSPTTGCRCRGGCRSSTRPTGSSGRGARSAAVPQRYGRSAPGPGQRPPRCPPPRAPPCPASRRPPTSAARARGAPGTRHRGVGTPSRPCSPGHAAAPRRPRHAPPRPAAPRASRTAARRGRQPGARTPGCRRARRVARSRGRGTSRRVPKGGRGARGPSRSPDAGSGVPRPQRRGPTCCRAAPSTRCRRGTGQRPPQRCPQRGSRRARSPVPGARRCPPPSASASA
ncbi:kinesin-like protein KIF19 isoform X1 [Dromaius novaehollandiae]|uniref:kinesin-like protein KIF19 isoform X1 n=1 Tax=Dromaius novaehollandiae TaxID=8790 RepID=UPI00311DE96C